MDLNLVPDELLREILLRLPALELLRFKTVCKKWRDLISNPMFVVSHLDYSKSQPDIIFQIYETLNIYSLNLQDQSMQARKFHLPPFEEREESNLPEYYLESHCNGLLLLRASACNLLTIYNPLTRSYKRLPREQYRQSSPLKFALIYESFVGKYKVFRIESSRRNWSVFTQGEEEWKSVHTSQEQQQGGFIYSSPLFVESKLQFTVCIRESTDTTFRYVLNSIDVLNYELVKMDTPFSINEFHQLSEMKGSLGITNIFLHHLETWVLDDRDQSLWTRCSVIRFDPLLSSYRDQGLDVIRFNPLLLSSPKFCSMHTKLFVYHDYTLAIYDMEKKELNKIKLSEIVHSSGCHLCEEAYGFHINSLVNWI